MLMGSAPLLLGDLLFDDASVHWTHTAIEAVMYLALVGSSLAMFLYYSLLGRIPAASVSAIGLAAPLVALILGRIMLHETIAPTALAGGAFILTGVALIIAPRRRA